jgi:hypothetical protein
MRFLLLGLALAGCSQFAPYEGIPRPALNAADPTPRIGVCYNAMFATPDEVRVIAEEACAGLGSPQLVGQDMRMAGCPLLTPVRATFACIAPTEAGR